MVRMRTFLAVGILTSVVFALAVAEERTPEPSKPPRHWGPMMEQGRPGAEGMPRGEMMGPGKGRKGREFSPEIREKIIRFVEEYDRETWERWQRVRKERPGEFEQAVRGQWQVVMKLLALKRRNPQLFEAMIQQRALERKSRKVAATLRAAKTEEEKEVIREELRRVLNDLLDLQHKQWEEQIKALEKRLNELKDMLEKRNENREEIINRRLGELTGEEDYLSWTFPKWAERELPSIPEEERARVPEAESAPEEGGEE